MKRKFIWSTDDVVKIKQIVMLSNVKYENEQCHSWNEKKKKKKKIINVIAENPFEHCVRQLEDT